MAEAALKRHNIGLYNHVKVNFNKFKELSGWRNKFAHSRITGDMQEKDLTFIIFPLYKKRGDLTKE
jgi:hypothetical protein